MRNGYDEAAAVAYARRWALLRNPAYLDFHGMGGDCTNFVSQCLYAGAGDVVQLGDPSGYTHAALIVDVRQGECYVAAHTLDSWMRPLSSYRQPARRFLHILGVRGRG